MIRKAFLAVVFFLVTVAFASESPKCSFGSAPLATSVKTFPGGEITFPWSMFNYHGDRVTLVNVTIPDTGWEITLKPSGTITLNPNSSSTSSYVRHPLTGVNVPSEEVYVTLKIPEDEEVNISRKIVLTANAYCNLSSGTIIPGIQGELSISVRVMAYEDYYTEFKEDDSHTLKFLLIGILLIIFAALFLKSKINNKRTTK